MSDKPSLIHKIFYFVGLFFGGRIGWEFGSQYGTTGGVLFAIAGALALSTFIGWIAMTFFGYEP